MKPLAQNTLIQNRYLIVQLIGKGGMGEVYLAVDQRLGSAVALKRTFFAGDEMLSNAFEREARILARMRHPVLPKVSDHFSEGEEQYLVMEHISGDDLAKRLEAAQKPFPLSWVMFWADQLLDALSYLHSHEPPIIHRDIKPQNLKLTDENHVILLDFGLSKNSAAPKSSGDSGSSSASSSASVVGYTPHYAPMEQIRGIGTSPKSDIYSLSATLYQLLTNVVPPDALSRADALLNGSPDPIRPPDEINSEVPTEVGVVILHGMEVSQDKRFENARDMQKALRKAHAQMQEAMSAHTVVMSAEGTSHSDSVPVGAPSMDKTEVMDFAGLAALSVPTAIAGSASEAPTNIVSNSQPAAFDPNATIAYDPNGNPSLPQKSSSEPIPSAEPVQASEPLQSDVKTEVFIAGSNSFPTPPFEEPMIDGTAVHVADQEVEDFREDFGDAATGFDSDNGGFAPDATMPIVAFSELSDQQGEAEPESPYTGGSPQGFESAAAATGGVSSVSSNRPSNAVASAPAKKGSGGKVFAIVGVLLVLFVVGVAAVGGGLYYYSNYYAAVPEPEPSPSPMPSIEPTPEPTFESAVANESNSNTELGSSSDSNSNSHIGSNSQDDLTVGPTPVPSTSSPSQTQTQTQPVASRQTPPTTAKKEPVKPTTVAPAAKATPKPTSTRDRKVILQ